MVNIPILSKIISNAKRPKAYECTYTTPLPKKMLYLMCGAPGSGKTTWLREHANGVEDIVISRDEIRFSYMTSKDDHYFAHEDKVFDEFIKSIQKALDDPYGPLNVYADATHLTQKSRLKVLRRLNFDNVDRITVIVVRASLKETIRRNHQRPYHAIVPDNIVSRMWHSFERPEYDTEIPVDTRYVEVPDDISHF